MRIVFMGTSGFGLPTLRLLLEKGYDIAGVVTVPDKPAGRGRKLQESPVKVFAREAALPLQQPERLKDPWFLNALRQIRPEMIVVVAFRILPPEVFTLPEFGSINLHASLLPRYRGAAPINWAIIRGEKETGVTTFFLEQGVDTGRIILQEPVLIGPEETAGELHDRLALTGAEVVLRSVQLISSRKAEAREQDAAAATPAPKIFREDCRIDWTAEAADVHNFIRGLSPVPGAYCRHGETVLKIYRSRIAGGESSRPPGTVLSADTRLEVSCGAGSVDLLEIQQGGRKNINAREFLRGYRLRVGEVLN